MAVLSAKAVGIRDATHLGGPVVVDRTLDEDEHVFARYFADAGFLDSRSFRTYVEYVDILRASLPDPDVIVYCQCTAAESEARLQQRPRPYQALYPADFVNRLASLYDQWWDTTLTPLKITLDTESFDLRTDAVRRDFAAFLTNNISRLSPSSADQPSLPIFDDPTDAPLPLNSHLRFSRASTAARASRRASLPLDAPRAYLAAPFTSLAKEPFIVAGTEQPLFFTADDVRSTIGDGPYRQCLESAAEALQQRGFRAILPHRDISGWGNRTLRPGAVARECLQAVRRASLVVAFLSTSFGAHVEVAAALAWGIPVILIWDDGVTESFFARELRQARLCGQLRISDVAQLAAAVASDDFDREMVTALARVRMLATTAWSGNV
jgi:deoxyadenosine/deoxycytidine kinase